MSFGGRRQDESAVDPVTGLLWYDEALDGAQDATLARLAAVVVEVDHHLTTTHAEGPAAADRLLLQAAERVAASLAGLSVVVLRLRGPHLLVVAAGASEETVADFGDRVAYLCDRRDGAGGLTVGYAVAPRDGVTVRALVRAAMVAVAHAKRQQPGGSAAFSSTLADDARDRMAVGQALQVAIERREIALAYQPQVGLADGAVVGVEVLARWFETSRGPIAPDRFVAIAEGIGLVRHLDLLVLDQACEQLRAWDAAGVGVPRISVNFSAETLRRGQIARPVAEVLTRHGIAPRRLLVEVAHSRVLEEPAALAGLAELGAIGVRLCLDDFGPDRAAVDSVAGLPVEELKIDRSFFTAGPDPAVLAPIIQVGTALGFHVAVVGIETADHEAIARGCGCQIGQGYHYLRPVPASDVAAWLEGRPVAVLPRLRQAQASPGPGTVRARDPLTSPDELAPVPTSAL